ncbi:MAG TPA: hypothetical protein VMM18_17215 [Gemmatimonadaceae bacterium]|nr:hypothetical protein [Gemmatimonadaceae bacterium]
MKSSVRRALALIGIVVVHDTAAAQLPLDWSLRPGRLEGAEASTWGLRYRLNVEPTRIYGNRPRFPTARSYAADLGGAVALRSGVTTEPLARGSVDLGWRIQLQHVQFCTPEDDPCPPPFRFDYGYVLLGARVNGEADSRANELHGALGLSALYRTPRGTQRGLWPLVPSASVDYAIVRPLASELRDTLGVELRAHQRVTVALMWNRIALTTGVPDWVSRARLEAEWRYFAEHGLEDVVEQAEPTRGTYVSIGSAYELTGKVAYVRDVFVSWAHGRHPTQERRKAWLVGGTIGSSR